MGWFVPALPKTSGCLHAYLVKSTETENEGLSVAMGDSKQNADEYDQSDLFGSIIDELEAPDCRQCYLPKVLFVSR